MIIVDYGVEKKMKQEYIIGVDVGTTETKATIFNSNGQIKGEASKELPIYFSSGGQVEQDLNEILFECLFTIKEALKVSKINPNDIACVAFTGQRDTICPINKKGSPLRRAISWQDTRGWEICKWIRKEVGAEKVYHITGLPVNTMPPASKIMWIKQKQPMIYEKTWKFVGIVDYIVWKFSDELRIDHSNANRNMLFDIRKRSWSDELFSTFNLDLEKMPDLTPPGTLIGNITKEISSQIRLPNDCKIVYGGGDQQCNTLGAGIVSPGRVVCILGTCTNVEAFSNKIPHDPMMSLQSEVHVIPNAYICEGGIGTTGTIYRWFRDEFAKSEQEVAGKLNLSPYYLLDREAANVPPGSHGLMLIPYFAGTLFPYWNAEDRGLIVGLHLKHKKEDFIRMILEGIAYEFRKMTEQAEKVTATKINLVRFIGGGAKSILWPQIFVDVLGIPGETLTVTQAGTLGAAILGMIAMGWHKDIAKATEKLVKVKTKLQPNSESHEIYEKLYPIYKKLYPRIQDPINEISRIISEKDS